MDKILDQITDYVMQEDSPSGEAMETARWCLYDSAGCAMLSLSFPACKKLLGPIIPGAYTNQGCRVWGQQGLLDPVMGAFNLGTMIRWLDYNDTWLAQEWGHPSDNFGGLLAVADYLSRQKIRKITVEDLLKAAVQAYEIQGVLSLGQSLNRQGYDHVHFVKVASAAVVTKMLGGNRQQVAAALSQAWIDGIPLRLYRHAPNTGSRKSWAAGDATARGVFLALLTMRGELGYETPLSAKTWGFEEVVMKGKEITLPQPLGSYVMENILFKVSFPAEFHAQTAVEAAIKLYPKIKGRWEEIEKIEIATHESALRIIDKKGELHNPAARDHCLQYMVAVALLEGSLSAEHYEDEYAQNPRIDGLREKMILTEEKRYSRDYLDPQKRSIASSLTIHLRDGEQFGPEEIEYPLGHRRRRQEAWAALEEKCCRHFLMQMNAQKTAKLVSLLKDPKALLSCEVSNWVDLFF